MLTLEKYLMGRLSQCPMESRDQIMANAGRMVIAVNCLLAEAARSGVELWVNPATGSMLTSGLRSPAINAATRGASATSRHMTGEAADINDPKGELDAWLMSPKGQAALERIGLWMEHPDATNGWAHVQIVPPRSGNRVFHP